MQAFNVFAFCAGVILSFVLARSIYGIIELRKRYSRKKFNDDLAATLRDDFKGARSAYEASEIARREVDRIFDDHRKEIARTMGIPESLVRDENAELARALQPEMARPAKARIAAVRPLNDGTGDKEILFDHRNGAIPFALDVDGVPLHFGYRPEELKYIYKAPHEFVGVEP